MVGWREGYRATIPVSRDTRSLFVDNAAGGQTLRLRLSRGTQGARPGKSASKHTALPPRSAYPPVGYYTTGSAIAVMALRQQALSVIALVARAATSCQLSPSLLWQPDVVSYRPCCRALLVIALVGMVATRC